jgi:hypothetical protein
MIFVLFCEGDSGEVFLLLLFLLILLLQFCEDYCLVNCHLFKFKCLFFIFIRLISTILLWGNIIYRYAKQCTGALVKHTQKGNKNVKLMLE